MKANSTNVNLGRATFLSMVAVARLALAQTPAALPQPDLVFYGSVVQSPVNNEVTPDTLSWTVSGNSETITASNTTIVVINTDTFYITRVPFEVRSIAGGPTLAATPDTLELTQAATNYTRTASVDYNGTMRPGNAAPGAETFSYGVPSQGLVERVDLVIGETFAEWSQRIFGMLVDPNGDADRDGLSNRDEYLGGTDPMDGKSNKLIKSFTLAPGGGFTFTWDSKVGRTYTVERSTTLDSDSWTPVEPFIGTAGTGETFIYTESETAGTAFFYRIVVND